MSIDKCITSSLFDERIRNVVMGADHEFKRLANTSTSLVERLSALNFDFSSLFVYEHKKGMFFGSKLLKPEIKISSHQLLFSSRFLEPEFLRKYKCELSGILGNEIKNTIKKRSQKIKAQGVFLDEISNAASNTLRHELYDIISRAKYRDCSLRIKNLIQSETLPDEFILKPGGYRDVIYLKKYCPEIINHIYASAKELIDISRRKHYIFSDELISGRSPNITGVMLCLSELLDSLKIYDVEIDNISNAILLNIVYLFLHKIMSGDVIENKDIPLILNQSSVLIPPHIFYLAMHQNLTQYKYIEKAYLLGQLLIFLMYKAACYSMRNIRVSSMKFYDDICSELPLTELKGNKLLSENFCEMEKKVGEEMVQIRTVENVNRGIKEISLLINKREALIFPF